MKLVRRTQRKDQFCAFCKRPWIEARAIVGGGNNAFICDSCVLQALALAFPRHALLDTSTSNTTVASGLVIEKLAI